MLYIRPISDAFMLQMSKSSLASWNPVILSFLQRRRDIPVATTNQVRGHLRLSLSGEQSFSVAKHARHTCNHHALHTLSSRLMPFHVTCTRYYILYMKEKTSSPVVSTCRPTPQRQRRQVAQTYEIPAIVTSNLLRHNLRVPTLLTRAAVSFMKAVNQWRQNTKLGAACVKCWCQTKPCFS